LKTYDFTWQFVQHLQITTVPCRETESLFSDHLLPISRNIDTDLSWSPLIFDMDNDGYRDIFGSNGIKKRFSNNEFLIYLEKKISGRSTEE